MEQVARFVQGYAMPQNMVKALGSCHNHEKKDDHACDQIFFTTFTLIPLVTASVMKK